MSQRCRFCCKSRKSNNPENLAKVDLWASLRLRRSAAPLRRSVVVFVRNDVVPHIAACETHQRSYKIFVVIPKGLFQHYLPEGDIGSATSSRIKELHPLW